PRRSGGGSSGSSCSWCPAPSRRASWGPCSPARGPSTCGRTRLSARFQAQFQARRIAHPAVFWACSIIGGLASFVGIIATLSGSWTPLISNSAGSFSIFGAVVSYGTWFWWVAGITVASLAVAVLLYLVGHRGGDRPAPVRAAAGGTAGAG